MSMCDMCGSESRLFTALIEDVELNVCKDCAGHGKIIRKPRPIKKVKKKKSSSPMTEREVIQVIKKEYPKLIRDKREKLGLKQEEFAKYLSEKESIIHQIEAGSYKPSLDLARKIEKQLKISLVEKKEIAPQKLKSGKNSSYTIGDMIKFK